ncbi:MAG: NERD domain-containing protein [Ignavibacteriales bacterium]|nr:NERD domain-containing protein [Ignavibacteriales bacterium]
MALMIPSECSETTLSTAEIDLFFTLRSSFDDEWTIFHSFNMLARNRENKIIDTEIDFLFYHHALGILVLEVKGGQIKFEKGDWYQNNIKMKLGPDTQARLNKYNVIKYLEKYLNGELPISIGHAVCFPDYYGDLDKLPSSIYNIVISGYHMPHLNNIVVSIMKQYKSKDIRPLDKFLARTIRNALMPIFEFGSSLNDIFGQEERRIFQLTEKQIELLGFISEYKKALIRGCAGSGKTIMAVKKAKELAANGQSVLMLCYNKMLCEALAKELDNQREKITVSTYHDFCIDELVRAKYDLDFDNKSGDFWTIEIPEMFLKLLETKSIKYDAVIVDEGQDFREEYWISINDLIAEDGFYYIFYDPDQNLYDTKILPPQLSTPFILSQNCRSTKKIFEAIKPYSESDIKIGETSPTGVEVKEFSESNSILRRKHLSQVLHELIVEQSLKESQIVILGAHSLKNTCIGSDNKIGQFIISENVLPSKQVIPYYTFMKYKGLESDVVILLDVDANDLRWKRKSALYTAMSRAKHLLYIFYSYKTEHKGN